MRRTLALVAGACTAVVLAGATAYAVTGDGATRSPGGTAALGQAPAAPAPAPAGAKAPEAAGGPVADLPKQVNGVIDSVGRQRIGALESVGSLVGYNAESDKQTFSYPGADYVKVHFDQLSMLPGDYV